MWPLLPGPARGGHVPPKASWSQFPGFHGPGAVTENSQTKGAAVFRQNRILDSDI